MGEKKLPKGITVREEDGREPKIRLSFTYKGIHCRETLDLAPSAANLKYAERLLGEIKNSIERGTFRYADHFPKSTKLKIFGEATTGTTLGELADYAIKRKQSRLAESTIYNYQSYRRLMGSLENIPAAEVTTSMIKAWVSSSDVAKRSVRNRLNIIKMALDEAIVEGLIQTNPARSFQAMDYVSAESQDREETKPDPFSPEEKQAILNACWQEEHQTLLSFAFETGMRTGELIALKWEDIDWIHNRVYIRRSAGRTGDKAPKTASGVRKIDMSSAALQALESQRKYTQLLGGYVFLDPSNGKKWMGPMAFRSKFWVRLLKRAKVRYRRMYNTRHTFATVHISQNANLWWLAAQMGHKSPQMLFDHYGAYMEEYANGQNERQNMVQNVQTLR